MRVIWEQKEEEAKLRSSPCAVCGVERRTKDCVIAIDTLFIVVLTPTYIHKILLW